METDNTKLSGANLNLNKRSSTNVVINPIEKKVEELPVSGENSVENNVKVLPVSDENLLENKVEELPVSGEKTVEKKVEELPVSGENLLENKVEGLNTLQSQLNTPQSQLNTPQSEPELKTLHSEPVSMPESMSLNTTHSVSVPVSVPVSMPEEKSAPISENLDLEPVQKLLERIELELASMGNDSAQKLQELQAKRADEARQAAEKLEKERQDKEEKERLAAEKRLENERKLAELKKIKNEEVRLKAIAEEEARQERLAKEEAERDRLKKEADAKREREVAAQRERDAAALREKEALAQRERDAAEAFKFEKIAKIKDIKSMAESVVNINNSKRDDTLKILIKIYNTLTQKNNKEQLDTYLSSIEYTKDIESIKSFIALRPITYGIFKSKENNHDKIVNLSHIFKFKDTFDAKEDGQKAEIINVINTQVGGTSGTSGTSGSEVGDKFRALVENNLLTDLQLKDLNDPNKNETQIDNESGLNRKLTDIDNSIKQVLASADIIQDFYEILLGAARVFVNMKPLNRNNNAPDRTPKTIFNIDGTQGAAAVAGGGVLQKGGYNYSDVISIEGEKHNYVKIGNLCSTNLSLTEDNKTFGPFAAIYPPQYNNSHIYGSMFGSKKLKELYLDTSLDTSMKFSPESFLLKNADTTKKIIPKGSEKLNNNESLQYQHLMKKLAREGNVIIFGYGFSGSGKTYLLIEGSPSPTTYDPSILEQFISNNTENIASVDFLEIYPYGKGEYENQKKAAGKNYLDYVEKNRDIKIFCSEEYKNDIDNQKKFGANSMKSEKIDDNIIKKYCNEIGGDIKNPDKYLGISDLFSTISEKAKIEYEYISNRIKLLERHRIHNLRILPTPNNDKSSRSFLQITINLKKNDQNSGKLVLFDMPGTENTVRIRTEFITTKIFNALKRGGNILLEAGLNVNPTFKGLLKAIQKCDFLSETINIGSGFEHKIVSVKWKPGYTREEKKTFYDDNEQYGIFTIFKYFIMLKKNFNDIGIAFGIDQKFDDPISEIGHDFAMFINGKDKKFYECEDNEEIYFMKNESFEEIVHNFINNYLNKKDKHGKSMFWTTEENNDNCKLSFSINSNMNSDIIKENEYDIFHDIFGIKINNDDKVPIPYFATSKSISGAYIRTPIKNLIWSSANIVDLNNYDYNFENNTNYIKDKKNIYFSNPMIKYIYIILNYLFTIYLRKTSKIAHEMESKTKPAIYDYIYRAATFFIYKYIKYIVNQGKGIVTNLEHLKFFFLSRTYAINDYNKNCLETAKEKDKAFVFNDGQKDALIQQPKYYKFSVKITDTVQLDETVNIGNMYQYKLLTVLQDLAGSIDTTLLQQKISVGTNYTLNLLTPKPGNQKISIFIMMTNLKIFRDDTTDDVEINNLESSAEDIKNKISQVCIAEYDTLDFAQSISSTSIAKNALKQLEAKKIETPRDNDDTAIITRLKSNDAFKDLFSPDTATVGGKRKFNMNELLEHKNKKPRTRRNLSSKNKKSKVFYNRSKKNI
jgi:hypothetical protein